MGFIVDFKKLCYFQFVTLKTNWHTYQSLGRMGIQNE